MAHFPHNISWQLLHESMVLLRHFKIVHVLRLFSGGLSVSVGFLHLVAFGLLPVS